MKLHTLFSTKIFKKIENIILFIFAFSSLLMGQTYLYKTYNVSNGLSSPTINDINQDTTGLMWFATIQGVSCYDGTDWINFSQKDGLPANNYIKILTNRQGGIWVLARYLKLGIYEYKPEIKRWLHINVPLEIIDSDPFITSASLIENDSGFSIGIGTKENGLFIYSEKGWIYSNSNTKKLPLNILNVYDFEKKFVVLTDHPSEKSKDIINESNVFVVDPEHPEIWINKNYKTPLPHIYAITFENITTSVSKEKRIWLFGKNWIGYYYQEQFHLKYSGEMPGFTDEFLFNQTIILPDRFGGLWVANHLVLFNLDTSNKIKTMGMLENLNATGAYCLFWDRESNLWYGTFRGAAKITTFRFENYRKSDGLFDNEVSALAQRKNGEMIFGHNGGFTLSKSNNMKVIKLKGADSRIIPNARVMDICIDNYENAWAAASRYGIVKINPEGQIKRYRVNKNILGRNKPNDIIFSSIIMDNENKIWASGENTLFQLQGDMFVPYRIEFPMLDYYRRIVKGKDSSIYLLTSSEGIVKLQNNQAKRIQCKYNKEANSIFTIYINQKDDNILVGTKAGLYRIENNTLIPLHHPILQISNPVYMILKDTKDNLWFGINNGLIRWDGTQMRHYNRKDGLIGNEINRAGGLIDLDGRLWFGTENGASCYFNEKDTTGTIPPLLNFLYLEVSGQSRKYSLNRDLVFNYRQDDFVFHFRGISFIDEKDITYNFRLEGIDPKWINNYRLPQNQVRYLNISPGKYRFYLQAVNSLGIKSSVFTSSLITINRPFYKAWWFFILIVIVIVLFIIITANYISRRHYAAHLEVEIHKRTKQLEESERELKEIFDNAHDAILVFDPKTEVVINVNHRATEIYNIPMDQFIGMSLEKISKNINRGKEKIKDTLESGDCLSFETVQYRKDGSEMFLEINASVINYRGKHAILSLNRDITERKKAEQQIQDSLKEKVILLQEIHHRVKNNLQIVSSLLDLQADTLENKDIIKVFQDSKNRIRSMALVHENLYRSGDLARIDGISYINKLVINLFESYGDNLDNIVPDVKIELDTFAVDMDTAIPLGLILTELITNALKHAFPSYRQGELLVKVYAADDSTVILVVGDNGVGFSGTIETSDSKTLGMQLINLLTQQLRGTITWEKNGGTKAILTIPYKIKNPVKDPKQS